jgi:hypothetical protein
VPITVRVRNVQSIRDATVVIDGFTVVTGPNNSGKTALQRGIRGVFTNAPAGPLVRHGADFLTVEIDFGDGNTVKWEKGWTKPNQKGSTVNRYTLNGVELSNVGRGCPPEVAALGVQSIRAGTQTVWPQVADQFSGVLFLVGSPGSAVAEAVADVERVGRLGTAQKLAESDQRSTLSTLKVRRTDEKALEKALERYAGLDDVGATLKGLVDDLAVVEDTRTHLTELQSLQERHRRCNASIEWLSGVEEVVLPTEAKVLETEQCKLTLGVLEALLVQKVDREKVVRSLEGVESISVPGAHVGAAAQGLQQELQELVAVQSRFVDTSTRVSTCEAALAGVSPGFHDGKVARVAQKAKKALDVLSGMSDTLTTTRGLIATLEGAREKGSGDLATAEAEVETLLEELGVCPTCQKPVDGHAHGGEG